ncbi:HU family DNA-binding protein [Brevibacillus laterosporus]|uniref:HU family DNA-binding protein n=1 Tax=Brevibacillus laterosporus TaxID=1465 RepID=A0A518VCL1_BRELA|nr:HU family DNA-binding protein [Brevibacillus laterosporus]
MNKTELSAKVAEKLEVSKKGAGVYVDAVLDAITDALVTGDKVKLAGFGTFEVRDRAARKGYNPKMLKELKEQGVNEEEAKAQAQLDIAASKYPAFKVAKPLKDLIK